MEDKLQQLTQKLYDEGLEKGRAEAGRLVEKARSEAAAILAEAQTEAEKIVARARTEADDLSKNAMTEVSLAGRQAVAKIKSEISTMIIARATAGSVKQSLLDPKFLQEMLLAVARNWNGAEGAKSDLKALLPEAQRAAFEEAFAASARELLAAGVEGGYSKEVKSGFRVSAKDQGYYISFSDEDFDALLQGYLREKVYNLLYNA